MNALRRLNTVLLVGNIFLLLVLLWVWRVFFVSALSELRMSPVPPEVVFVASVTSSPFETAPIASDTSYAAAVAVANTSIDVTLRDVADSTSTVVTSVAVAGGGTSRVEVQTQTQELPREVNIPVPFLVQAPHADWGLPYQEACEEASVLMAAAYVKGEPTGWTPEEADLAIQKLVAWQRHVFGFYEDTTAEETAQMLLDYFSVTTTLVYNPTGLQLREYLAHDKLVLVPAYGKVLPNPNFRNGGPLYHMLVVKGYTDEGFIANDPGTRKGHNFFYTDGALLNANHDWNGGDVEHGERVVLVVPRGF